MPASVADFVKAAEESGILTADSLAEFLQGVAPETDATALANRLVKAGRITAFQAKHIYGGKAGSLILGPYVVVDLLGKGGMGYVYKAEHRRMRRVVALKVIAKAALKSPAAVLRFEREVHAAALLEHPNIVTAFDAGEAAGTHYLVMQFVDGRNLSEVVKELGPQPVGRAVDWVLQAARGLAYAHGKGVVHRDIKPGNLLVDQDGAVKILDMGLARLETLDADQDQLTGTGQIMGTVDYMAPEQAMDTRRADARSDIYSLGVTLWYLLTGRPLFSGDTVMNKMMAHMHTAAPSLSKVRDEISPDLEAIFQKMVAKKPADRFQSMQEVITAIESLPRDDASPGPPSIAFGRGGASLGPLDTGGTQTLQRQKPRQAEEADENTARLSAVDVDTDAGVKNIRRTVRRPAVRKNQASVAIAGGALGACVLIGLVMFAFSGRRDGKPTPRAGKSDAGSKAQAESSLDSFASVAVPEPAVPTPQPNAEQSAAPPIAEAPFDATQARKHQEAWAKHLGIGVETTNSIGQTLVLIPPGKFKMGDYGKTVDITLTEPFLLGETEVTQGQWKEVMGTEPWKGREYTSEGTDVAATFISWADAAAFCEQLTQRERSIGKIGRNQDYRLPTETEWDFACRGGTVTTFSFGDSDQSLREYGWFGGGYADKPISGGNTAKERYAHAVRLKRPNGFGLFDVHGNVEEWVTDREGDGSQPQAIDPQGSSDTSIRVYRGGCWRGPADRCRSAYRSTNGPGTRNENLGFRIALTITVAAATPSTQLPLAIAPFDATQARKHQEAWAKHLGVPVETTNSIGQTLVVIPPGKFTMGEGDKTVDVTLTEPFLLGQTEVTQGQWKAVMGTEPWKGRDFKTEGPEVAVTWISWNDAVSFCDTLTDRERSSGLLAADQRYRLPTEAEWEYACRAGTRTAYCFGDDLSRLGEYAWFGGGLVANGGQPVPGGNTATEMYAHAVRLKQPNAWRLFDVHGNAGEWVSDMYGPLPSGPVVNPQGAASHTDRVRRGLGWSHLARDCGSALRTANGPQIISYNQGFRIALSPPTSSLPKPDANTDFRRGNKDNSRSAPFTPPPAVAPFDATQARAHQEAWAKYLGIEVETTNSIGQKLVVIPAGKFFMGEGEKTVDVTLTKPFLFGRTAVTNAQWKQVMGTLPSEWKDDDRPVEQVTWDNAVEFCRKLSALPEERKAAREYRLPTEAEWEYACRAGTNTKYSFGDDESRRGEYGWFDGHSRNQTHPVGQKKPNAWGLFDMNSQNVWEWCSDWYGDYGTGPVTDPQGPSGASARVCRGGSWRYHPSYCRSANRGWIVPSSRFNDLGFRLALSPPAAKAPGAPKHSTAR